MGNRLHQKSDMVQKIKYIILILLLIVTLLSFLYFIHILFSNVWLEYIKVDYNLVPVDVFSLFISSAITIWVGYYVVKNLSEQRFEKEMLINDLRAIEKEIEQVELAFRTSRMVDLAYVSGKMNTIKRLIDRFAFTAEMSNNFINKEVSSINDTFFSLYSASTDFDASSMNSNDIDCTSIYQLTDDLVRKLRTATIHLNKK